LKGPVAPGEIIVGARMGLFSTSDMRYCRN